MNRLLLLGFLWSFSLYCPAHLDHEGRLAELDELMADKATANHYLARGKLNLEEGRLAEAKKDFKALETLVGPVDAALAWGLWFSKENASKPGGCQKAIEFFTVYLSEHPQSEEGLSQRGQCYARQGGLVEAIADYTALTVFSKRPEHFLQKAQWYAESGDYQRAVSTVDEAEERIGQLPHFQQQAIQWLIELSRWETALARIDKLPHFMQSAPQQRLQTAWLLEKNGDKKSALQVLETLIGELKNHKRKSNAIIKTLAEAEKALATLRDSEG